MPSCSNGHILCLPCKEKILEKALEERMEASCPTCKGSLGNHTSLLAARLLEGVVHECKFEECDEKMLLEDLERHEKGCGFRPVRCPFSGHILPLINILSGHQHDEKNRLTSANLEYGKMAIFERAVTQGDEGFNGTDTLHHPEIPGARFFFKSRITANRIHCFEVEGFTDPGGIIRKPIKFKISILDKAAQPVLDFITATIPINLKPWGDFSLMVPEESLAKVGTRGSEPNQFYYNVGITLIK